MDDARRKYIIAARAICAFAQRIVDVEPPDEELMRWLLADARRCWDDALVDLEKYGDTSCATVANIFETTAGVLGRRLAELRH